MLLAMPLQHLPSDLRNCTELKYWRTRSSADSESRRAIDSHRFIKLCWAVCSGDVKVSLRVKVLDLDIIKYTVMIMCITHARQENCDVPTVCTGTRFGIFAPTCTKEKADTSTATMMIITPVCSLMSRVTPRKVEYDTLRSAGL